MMIMIIVIFGVQHYRENGTHAVFFAKGLLKPIVFHWMQMANLPKVNNTTRTALVPYPRIVINILWYGISSH
jgi:hypothetical protein